MITTKAILKLLPAAARASAVTGSLALSFFISTEIGLHETGIFAIAFSSLFGLTIITKLGLDTVTLREVALQEKLTKDIFSIFVSSTIKRVFLLSIFLTAFVIWCCINYLPEGSAQYLNNIIISSLSVPALSICYLLSSYLRGARKYTLALLAEPTSFLLYTFVVIAPFWLLNALINLTHIWIIFNLIAYTSVMVFAFICMQISQDKNNTDYFKIKFNLNIYLQSLSEIIKNAGLILVVGYILIASEVGVIHIAQRVGSVFSFILSIYYAIAPSDLAKLWNEKKYSTWINYYLTCCKQIILLSLPLLIAIFLFSDQILTLANADSETARTILRIFAFAFFIQAACGPSVIALQMIGHEKTVFTVSWVSGLLVYSCIFFVTSSISASVIISIMLVLSQATCLIILMLIYRRMSNAAG